MGIILQHVDSNRIIFFMKGADTVMKDYVPEILRAFVLESCE
jgi:glutaredoxin-related protein